MVGALGALPLLPSVHHHGLKRGHIMPASPLAQHSAQVRSALDKLPVVGQCAFACSCAERLLPQYKAYRDAAAGTGGKPDLEIVLDQTWKAIKSSFDAGLRLRGSQERERIVAAVPDEDLASAVGVPYGIDAAVAIVHALDSMSCPDGKSAAWAARKVTDVLFSFVEDEMFGPRGVGDELEIIRHPLIQAALASQQNDLSVIAECLKSQDAWQSTVDLLRERARQDAGTLFGNGQA